MSVDKLIEVLAAKLPGKKRNHDIMKSIDVHNELGNFHKKTAVEASKIIGDHTGFKVHPYLDNPSESITKHPLYKHMMTHAKLAVKYSNLTR